MVLVQSWGPVGAGGDGMVRAVRTLYVGTIAEIVCKLLDWHHRVIS